MYNTVINSIEADLALLGCKAKTVLPSTGSDFSACDLSNTAPSSLRVINNVLTHIIM
jgi:hypothetical protein